MTVVKRKQAGKADMVHHISPGSLLSAKDQVDNGLVMLRTVTQISSNELQQSGKGNFISKIEVLHRNENI